MFYRVMLSAVLLGAVSTAAFAQEGQYSQTLDEQLHRVLHGKPAVPGEWNKSDAPAGAKVESAPALVVEEEQPLSAPPAMDIPDAPAPVATAPALSAPASDQVEPLTTTVVDEFDTEPQPQVAPRVLPSHMIHSQGGGAIPALPLDVQQVGNARFVTGGVGDEELAQLKAIEKDFSVQILMTASNGAYLSDMLVRLFNKKGQIVLSAENAGPFFYADLPDDSYTLEMTNPRGAVEYTKFVVSSNKVKRQIRFK